MACRLLFSDVAIYPFEYTGFMAGFFVGFFDFLMPEKFFQESTVLVLTEVGGI
jgi:hypothetical protein